ncbi:MAG: YaiI/YqxD family protein [Micropepsaceae bacterium]
MAAPQSEPSDMPQIYVDGDACPVKAEVERVASRHGLQVYIVSNGGIRPSANPLMRQVTVAEGADAADDWIAENITDRDIAITADIPLASRCLKSGARVLGPNGNPFTEESIGMALGMRELHRHLREMTAGGQTHHASFNKQDRSRFLGALENEVQTAKRKLGQLASPGHE